MVWGGDVTSAAHSSSRSNVDLEIGCLIDLSTGLVTFTVNGKEISTSYQVQKTNKPGRICVSITEYTVDSKLNRIVKITFSVLSDLITLCRV